MADQAQNLPDEGTRGNCRPEDYPPYPVDELTRMGRVQPPLGLSDPLSVDTAAYERYLDALMGFRR